MSDDKTLNSTEEKLPSDTEVTSNEVWPRKLNKLIIGVGIIAFGLIIADRLINAFQASDAPEPVAIERNDAQPGDEGDLEDVDVAQPIKAEDAELKQVASDTSADDELSEIENVFGGKLVFVSASEPLYVVTEDDQRFDIGGSIDDETTLAGITDQRVVLERSGELVVIDLPEPGVN